MILVCFSSTIKYKIEIIVFKYKEIDRAIENLNDRDTYLNELNNEIGWHNSFLSPFNYRSFLVKCELELSVQNSTHRLEDLKIQAEELKRETEKLDRIEQRLRLQSKVNSIPFDIMVQPCHSRTDLAGMS